MATERILNDFVHVIHEAVDSAGEQVKNDGNLWKQPSGDLDHVKFPAPINALLPEGVDLQSEPLIITARDWHGRGYDQLAFWLETKDQHGWEMPGIFANYDPYNEHTRFEISNELIDESTFSRYVTSYMSLVPDLPAYIAAHGMAMAFRRGISYIAKSGIADSHLIKRTGHKITSNSHSLNGFQLEASVMNDTDMNGETTTTVESKLNYYFQPNVEKMPYGGCLLKAVSVTLQNEKIIASARESTISLMDNPFIDGDQIGTYSHGYASIESTLPQSLKEHLHPDNVVSEEDVSYFIDLVTKPLQKEDVTIL